MNTIQDIQTEITNIETRLSEITQKVGKFVRENDNDAYSLIWPEWAIQMNAEGDLLYLDLKDAERRLAKEEEREERRAEHRARNAEKEMRSAFAEEKAAAAAADPRETWVAVNAHRTSAGLPTLSEGFIGSAHVQRIALTLRIFAK